MSSLTTSLVVKYIFNQCSSIDHQNNSFFQSYPHAKMDAKIKSLTGSFYVVEGNPVIINGFSQLFPGFSKQHNDTPSLRLKWFETILNNLINRFGSDITSIAFPVDLNEQYLLKLENFAKKIFLTSKKTGGGKQPPLIVDYNGKKLINLEQDGIGLVKYHSQTELVFKQPSFCFPYKVTKIVNLEQLNELVKDIKNTSSTDVEKQNEIIELTPKVQPKLVESKAVEPKEVEAKVVTKVEPKKVEPKVVAKVEPELPTPTPTNTRNEQNSPNETQAVKKVVKKVRILKNKYLDLFKSLDPSWQQLFAGQDVLFSKLKEINDTIVKSINDDKVDVFPYPYDLTFNCFNQCRFDKLKVVIIGQDPYHANKNEAMGLSFSVPVGITVPPSLKNIYKELSNDIDGFNPPEHGDLTTWAKQGVLLLNTSLTVVHKTPGSHMELWKPFTSKIIELIARNSKDIVFILWGTHAKAYASTISKNNHLILEATHPSPLSANKGGFFGCRHFSKTNQYLEQKGKSPINWIIS